MTFASSNRGLVIAVDGPAGSGKSTVARLIAKRLNYLYIDTGAMYRALTLKALKEKADLENEDVLAGLAKKTDIKLRYSGDSLKVYLDSEEVTTAIRTPEVTNSVRYIARAKPVRAHMAALQRKLGENGGVVLEGRDIGTVVFPDADKKFYLDASFDVRAGRRYKELKEANADINEESVRNDLKRRDDSDINRSIGPLKKADDAIFVNTSDLTIEGVVDKLINLLDAK
jgi:CMP/dCMP kinase